MHKKITKPLILILLTLSLSACQKQVNDIGQRMGWVKNSQEQWIEGSNYYEFPEFSPGKQYKSESSFCYKVQTDILCYDRPREGWENRMVGYQEPLRPKNATSSYRVENTSYTQTPPVISNVPDYSAPVNSPVNSSTPFGSSGSTYSSGEISAANLPPLPTVTVQ